MRRYVITAGTSQYANTSALPSVPQDLADVGAALGSVGYSLALTLTDPRADELRRALDTWVSSSVRGDDVLILYYTGHGERDANRHYLLCADSVPGRLPGTALATEDVVRILTSEGVRRLLLIVDTCYAGQGTIDAVQEAARLQRTRLMEVHASDGLLTFAVIAAARTRETASDGAFAHAFTAALANPSLAGQRQQHLELKQLVISVNAELGKRNALQRATHGVLVDDDDFYFIPNPHYRDDLPSEGVDLAVQRTWVSIEGRRRREELASHFQPRALGTVDAESDGQDYFSGRQAVLARLASGTGSVIVTGSAGVGKSAVLGRLLVTTSLVDVAIHARHKVLDDIVSGIAAAIRSDVVTPEDLMTALTDRSMSIVIDALDEAGSPGDREPTRIARFLRDLARLPGVRLIVGTRPHVAPTLGDGFDQINLDNPQWVTHEDLVAYARKLLTAPHGPGSTSAYSVSSAVMVAERIATQSYPNYLKVRLAARAFADRDDVPVLPVGDTGEVFRWALSEQLGSDDSRARALLTPLAFAEGAGLPWGSIWPAVASAISGVSVSTEDIDWLLGSNAQEHVVEVVDSHGRSVYRLYHEAFADQLRADAPQDTQSRIVDALMTDDWSTADPYVRTHLPAHAAAAGRLAELVAVPGFLLAAERASLLRVLHTIDSPNANAYQHAAALLTDDLPLAERASVLEMSAHLTDADDLKAALPYWPDRPWRVAWSSVQTEYTYRRIGLHDSDVTAVASGEVDGTSVLVTGDANGEVRMWDVATGDQIGATRKLHTNPVASLHMVGPAIVTLCGHDLITVWYPESNRTVELPASSGTRTVACQLINNRFLVAAGTLFGKVRVWDARTGDLLVKRRAWFWRGVDMLGFVTVRGEPAVVITSWILPKFRPTVTRVSVVSMAGRRVSCRRLRGADVVAALDVDGEPTLVTWQRWGRKRRDRRWPLRQVRLDSTLGGGREMTANVDFQRDGDRMLVCYTGSAFVVWNLRNGMTANAVGTDRADYSGTKPAAPAVYTDRRGTWLVHVAGRSVQAVKLTGSALTLTTGAADNGMAVSDGKVHFASRNSDRTVSGFDVVTGASTETQEPDFVDRVFGGGPAPAFLAYRTMEDFRNHRSVQQVRDLGRPERKWEYVRPKRMYVPGYSVAVEGDDMVIVATSGQELVYWRPVDGEMHYRRLPDYSSSKLGVLLDGKVAVLARLGGGDVAMVDVDGRRNLWRRELGADTIIHIGQLGGRPVGVCDDNKRQVRILDLRTGEDVGDPLHGHAQPPTAADLVELNGHPFLVTGSGDRTVRVWDLRTRTQRALIDVGATVMAVKFAPPDCAIIVGTETSVMRIELDEIAAETGTWTSLVRLPN
jgi:hypothetical protein